MKLTWVFMFVWTIFGFCFEKAVVVDTSKEVNSTILPPIETFIVKPIEFDNVSLWVPAARIGPLINNSCMPKNNCSFSFSLPASVDHKKTKECPEQIGRLLAEYFACYHEEKVPLTIFNGWQWEYSYNLSEFKSATYILAAHGGSWENSWEGILTQSSGSLCTKWLCVGSSNNVPEEPNTFEYQSDIDVKTFSYLRIRDGYPKQR